MKTYKHQQAFCINQFCTHDFKFRIILCHLHFNHLCLEVVAYLYYLCILSFTLLHIIIHNNDLQSSY